MSEQQAYADLHGAGRSGTLTLTITFASALVLAIVLAAFSFLPSEASTKIAAVLFALFAIAGICGFFFFATGLFQFSGQVMKSVVGKQICDGSSDGLVVIGAGGKIIYANEAYSALASANGLADVRPVERLF